MCGSVGRAITKHIGLASIRADDFGRLTERELRDPGRGRSGPSVSVVTEPALAASMTTRLSAATFRHIAAHMDLRSRTMARGISKDLVRLLSLAQVRQQTCIESQTMQLSHQEAEHDVAHAVCSAVDCRHREEQLECDDLDDTANKCFCTTRSPGSLRGGQPPVMPSPGRWNKHSGLKPTPLAGASTGPVLEKPIGPPADGPCIPKHLQVYEVGGDGRAHDDFSLHLRIIRNDRIWVSRMV